MSEIHVLVVDDEKEIADLVEIYLVSDGYKVYKASNALEGLEILEKETIHLVLLDIMMPGMDGLEMCRKIRETNNIPIIMLSARSADLDKILGLGTGADDYVTKPFNPLELTARVKSQLRRYTQLNPQSGAGNQVKNEISLKGLTINKDNHKVTVYGEEIKLTPIEFDILYLLASNPGRVFSTDEIFEKVWNEKVYEANNTVMVHIRRLRGKMKEDTRQNKIITTVWGVGFFPAPDGDRDTDGICLSSVGHRDLLSHFFCPPGAVHALYQPDLVRDSEYFRGRFEYDDRGAGRRRVYGDGGQFK